MAQVAVTDAMAQGKFGYDWMASAERVVDSESAMQIQDLVLMYLKRHPKEIRASARKKKERKTQRATAAGKTKEPACPFFWLPCVG